MSLPPIELQYAALIVGILAAYLVIVGGSGGDDSAGRSVVT